MSNEFKLVPVELTDEMVSAVIDLGRIDPEDVECIWIGMLAAAPQPPADRQGEPVAWLITLIDDGSTYCITEDKLRADRLIADGDYVIEPLYLHGQPATVKVDERAEFEGRKNRKREAILRNRPANYVQGTEEPFGAALRRMAAAPQPPGGSEKV